MPKYVKATVLLCVEDVEDWRSAYEAVNDLVGGPAMYNHKDGKSRSAYLHKVISTEGYPLTDCVYCTEPILEGRAWREVKEGGMAHEGCWLVRHPKDEW